MSLQATRPRQVRSTNRARLGVVAVVVAVSWLISSTDSKVQRLMSAVVGAEYVDQVGVILQQNSFDCGVAAAEMAINALTGEHSAFDSARTSARDHRRGLSFQDMRALAATRNVQASGRRMTLFDLHQTKSPAVLQFRNHFVLFDGFDARGAAVLRDPAIGRLRMSEDDLERHWTGMVLVFSTNPL